MLEGVEALIALERCGTISEAALSLRLTQSAVTKRIQALQSELGFRLTEPDGRRVRLTPQALNYVMRASPLLIELKSLSSERRASGPSDFTLAMADSIASSWGPSVLREAIGEQSQLRLKLHAHRSALVVEAVRLGRYHIGLCTTLSKATDLVSYPVMSEPFVLLHSQFDKKLNGKLPLITIETGSATWPAIAHQVNSNSVLRGMDFMRVESFTAAFQMARAGFGNGLIPLGLVKERGIDGKSYRVLPAVHREISLVTRKTVGQLEAFQTLLNRVTESCRHFQSNSRKL